MEHTKTKDTLLFQNLDSNLSTEEERRGQISTKVKQNKSEQQQLQENLHKLLAGDKKLTSRPLTIGKTPNILAVCGANKNLDLTIKKSVIDKCLCPELRDDNGRFLAKIHWLL